MPQDAYERNDEKISLRRRKRDCQGPPPRSRTLPKPRVTKQPRWDEPHSTKLRKVAGLLPALSIQLPLVFIKRRTVSRAVPTWRIRRPTHWNRLRVPG